MGRYTASAETLKPDPRYKDKLVSKFVNYLMNDGKKSTALAAFYQQYVGQAASMQDLLDTIHTVSGYDPTSCAHDWLRVEPVGPVACP